jgi:hypothetical protein
MQEEKVKKPKRLQKSYSAEKRSEHLKTWSGSGLSMSEYCRRYQLGVSTLSKWALQSGISTKVKLKPLKMCVSPLSVPNGFPLEIRLSNGVQIRMGGDLTLFKQVLEVIQSCN